MSADLFQDPHPHSRTVYILKYTIEIVSVSHRLQAMASHSRDGMTSKIKYPTISCPLIYSGLPPLIAELRYILKYTIETVSVAHRLQAMASQQGWNKVEN